MNKNKNLTKMVFLAMMVALGVVVHPSLLNFLASFLATFVAFCVNSDLDDFISTFRSLACSFEI